MKHLIKTTAICLSVAVAVSACQGHNRYSSNYNSAYPIKKADIGALAGGIGGAFAGSNLGKGSGKTLGIAAGTLLGAFIGHEVGTSLDRADMLYMQRTAQRSFESTPTGKTMAWQNPDSGNQGTITPTRTYQVGGQYCREFNQTMTVGGQTEKGFGQACRRPDGSWEIQS